MGGLRPAIESHQTLRATVDWPYRLLSPVERLVSDRLAAFSGSFDSDPLRSRPGGDGRPGRAGRAWGLAATSMVVADEAVDGGTRCWLFKTLRRYAHQCPDESGQSDRWRRHVVSQRTDRQYRVRLLRQQLNVTA